MAEFRITMHINGEIVDGLKGAEYVGGEHMSWNLRFKVSSLYEIHRRISRRILLEENQRLSQIIWRCPQVVDEKVIYYVYSLEDDGAVAYMFDFHSTIGVKEIQLFLKLAVVDNESVQLDNDVYDDSSAGWPCAADDLDNYDYPSNSYAATGSVSPSIVSNTLPEFFTSHDEDDLGRLPDHENVFARGLGSNDELHVKMLFRDRNDAVSTIRKYTLFRNREIRVYKSYDGLWEVRCLHRSEGCNWRALVRRRPDDRIWELRKYDFPHTCRTHEVCRDNHSLTSDVIAGSITHVINKDPSISVPIIQKHMMDTYRLEPTYQRAWYAKQRAIADAYGDWEESFHLLSRWLLALKLRIPGSVVDWTLDRYYVDGEEIPGYAILDKVFWCFRPCIDAFKEVRPVIFIDGTHLYGKYNGVLLMASAVDGDNRIIPLAHAVVHRENNDTWPWFLNLLHTHVVGDRKPVTIISDRHKSITYALSTEEHWREPNAYWRYCFRHVKSNYRARVKNDDLANKFYSTAKEWEVQLLEKGLQELREKDPNFHQFEDSLGPRSRWTIAEDNGARWGHDTTNVAESVNGVLKKARNLPILALVMTTMHKTIEWFERRRAQYGAFVAQGKMWFDRTDAHINTESELAKDYIARPVHTPLGLYEIELAPGLSRGQALYKYRVDLKNLTCDCNKFQSLRLPCSHAIAACQARHVDPYSLVHHFHSVEASLRAYDGVFYPIGDKLLWPETDIIWVPDPERERTKTGRPISTRIHNDMDVQYSRDEGTSSTQNRCGFCHQPGHNRKSCPINPGRSARRV